MMAHTLQHTLDNPCECVCVCGKEEEGAWGKDLNVFEERLLRGLGRALIGGDLVHPLYLSCSFPSTQMSITGHEHVRDPTLPGCAPCPQGAHGS